MPENLPLPTMPGPKWHPEEVADLRRRHPGTCWEPYLTKVCALPAGHKGLHGWNTRLDVQRPALIDGSPAGNRGPTA